MSNSGLSLVLGRILVDAVYFDRIWDTGENREERVNIALEVTRDLTSPEKEIIKALNLEQMKQFAIYNSLPGGEKSH